MENREVICLLVTQGFITVYSFQTKLLVKAPCGWRHPCNTLPTYFHKGPPSLNGLLTIKCPLKNTYVSLASGIFPSTYSFSRNFLLIQRLDKQSKIIKTSLCSARGSWQHLPCAAWLKSIVTPQLAVTWHTYNERPRDTTCQPVHRCKTKYRMKTNLL